MRGILIVVCCASVFVLSTLTHGAAEPQVFPTSAGPVKITPLNHASTLIEAGGKTIYLDPAKPAKLTGLPKADLILITDIHGDHMDPDSIKEISKADTEIFAAPAVVQTVTSGKAHCQRRNEDLAGLDHRGDSRLQPEARSGAGKIFSRQGTRAMATFSLRRQALLFLGRHRRRSGDARAQEHRRGVRVHESAVHDAAGRGSGRGEGVPSEDCDSVPLPRV